MKTKPKHMLVASAILAALSAGALAIALSYAGQTAWKNRQLRNRLSNQHMEMFRYYLDKSSDALRNLESDAVDIARHYSGDRSNPQAVAQSVVNLCKDRIDEYVRYKVETTGPAAERQVRQDTELMVQSAVLAVLVGRPDPTREFRAIISSNASNAMRKASLGSFRRR